MIDFSEDNAREELKRADHLIYVTLKYTRTVDVIKNTIKRLITAIDFTINDALHFFKHKKKVKDIPLHPNLKADILASLSSQFKKDMAFYAMLKEIDKSDFDKKEEYRKNVALIIKQGKKSLDINIEVLKSYFEKTIDFVNRIDELKAQ